jgi:hypothetical protein
MSKQKMFQVVQLAAYYEKTLSDDQVKMYVEDLGDLTDEETSTACKIYRSIPENTYFPRPMAKLVQLIKKPISTEDSAEDIASLMLKAVSDFGHTWADGTFRADYGFVFKGRDVQYLCWEYAAETVFGKEAVEIARRYGGWKQFCLTVNDSPDGVIRAQIARLAKSLINNNEVISNFNLLEKKQRQQLSMPTNLFPLRKPYKDDEDP